MAGVDDFNRLIGHVRAGKTSVPFQSLVLLPGAMPAEAVLRELYSAGSLERRFGLDLELVVSMENQSLHGGSSRCGPGPDPPIGGIVVMAPRSCPAATAPSRPRSSPKPPCPPPRSNRTL